MNNRKTLLIASFLTLVAAGAGFATRGAAGAAWAKMGIGQGDFGAIMGYGFLGFGFFIFFGGMFVEIFGYKKLMIGTVVLHVISAAMLIIAPSMYAGWVESVGPVEATAKVVLLLKMSVLLFSVCNGLYEAAINPLVGQLYPENQTHYLNILHAGWPGGMILGGLLAAAFQNETAWITEIPWQYALASYSLVLIILLLMIIKQEFPPTVSASGKSSFGVLFSCFLSIPFIVLIVLHALIGYMELGVDSWTTRLMENLIDNSVTILIYTSLLMFILRFFAGPIVHKLNPIGLLTLSSVIAVFGLLWLSQEITSVFMIFAAATLYSLGKAFLWPTMLAVAGERYPQSGAIAMCALGAAGMISVGFVGGPMIGAQQSESQSASLESKAAETFARYEDGEASKWGYKYRKLNPALSQAAMEYAKAAAASEEAKGDSEAIAKYDKSKQDALAAIDKQEKRYSTEDSVDLSEQDKAALKENIESDGKNIVEAFDSGSRRALFLTALLPLCMSIGFIGLFVYYKSIGGYSIISLDAHETVADNSAPYGSTENTGDSSSAEEPAAEYGEEPAAD